MQLYPTVFILLVARAAAEAQPAMPVAQPATPTAKAPAPVTGDRTITKVVKALQDMLDKSKEDGENERELYAKYKCYCDTNEKSKKESIEKLTKDIDLLEASIEELRASTGGLSTEVAKLSADMDTNKQAQATAEAIRKKENEAFVAEEADLTGAIAQMKDAIQTLAEVGADQTLGKAAADHEVFMGAERSSAGLLGISTSVRQALVAASALAKDTKQAAVVESLLQAPFTATYTAQSGQVVGILKNMRDTFTENLASARATEKAAAEAYEKLMKTLKGQYDLMFNSHEEKQGDMGSNDGNLAAKKTQLDTARKTKAEDEEFLAKLKDMCAAKAKDYAKRCELRANEEVALAEAIAILNSDAAFATFGKVAATSSGATGFVQLRSVSMHRPAGREQVQNMLRRAAGSQKSVLLAKLAALVEAGNPFDTVLKEIKKMIALIDAEGKADEEQLAWCNEERTTSDRTIAEKSAEIDTLSSAITELTNTIHDPETGLLAQIKTNEDDLSSNLDNQASETKSRTEENVEYQKNIATLVETETILNRALAVLKNYYDQFSGESLLQQREEPAPPSTWENDSYKGQSEAGHGAIGMLEFILKNTKLEEQTAHDIESESQHAYEDSMQELKDGQASLEKTLSELQNTLAEKEKELREKEADLKSTKADKAAVEAYLLKIKPGCDFITANMELRTTNRANEKEQMEKAIVLIKGTPAYKTAVAEAHVDSLGDCAEICEKVGEAHVECKACLAKVTVPGYCAGHEGTEGC